MERKQNRVTRCRTGCMRCRIRRRKCDEGKPRCRNCIDRNFRCQYGPQLTFLTKNARTVQPSEVETPSASYEAIRFINEQPSQDCDEIGDDGPELTCFHTDLTRKPHQADSSTIIEDGDKDIPFWPEPAPSMTDEQNHTILNDKDESAVAGLLALGMNEPDFGLSDLVVPSRKGVASETALIPSHVSRQPPFTPQNAHHPLGSHTEILPSTEIQALLRHYRYEVASWLDICDLGQSFGINGLQLAMVSPSIWSSILDLSQTSLNQLHPEKAPWEGQKAFLQHRDSGSEVDVTCIALRSAIDEVKGYISNISGKWNSERQYNCDLLGALSSHAVGRDINSAIYWLFIRLDIATAIASSSGVRVPLPPSFPYLTKADIVADPFEMVFYHAYHPLWLCARAIEFTHNEDVSPDRPPLHIWMQLVEELQQWYRERPQEFVPMLELEVDDQLAGSARTFPVVLFANGAGVFGNQLYHTAMLLLLHNRPRTAQIADFQTAVISPLWHAQRICSIALHNDRRECWDPCLMASFLLAARGMTHESQQREVMCGVDRISRVTGWDTNNALKSLRAHWYLVDEIE